MSFEIEGKLIVKSDIQQVTDSFRKREFVIEKVTNSNGREFIDTIKFQLIQDRCSELDGVNVNDQVKINFNIKGRKWEKNGQTSYFNNLEAWRVTSNSPAPMNDVPPPDISEADMIPSDDSDELPF